MNLVGQNNYDDDDKNANKDIEVGSNAAIIDLVKDLAPHIPDMDYAEFIINVVKCIKCLYK
jgi:hypothetical protein